MTGLKNGQYFENGNEFWYKDGFIHREDGPAAIYYEGTKCWHREGWLHREDGPAIIRASGTKEWFLRHRHLTKEQWWESISDEMKIRALFNGDGV